MAGSTTSSSSSTRLTPLRIIALALRVLISLAKGPSVAAPLPAHICPTRRGIIISAGLSPPNKVAWMKETASFFEKDPRPIMLFNGVCNLCNGSVKFVRVNDRRSVINKFFCWRPCFREASEYSICECRCSRVRLPQRKKNQSTSSLKL